MKKLDLNTLQKYIQVRPITLNDYEQIYELALKCFPGMQPWGKEQIASQLETFPQGQLCVEYQGRIIGSSSSLIIDFDEYGEKPNRSRSSANGRSCRESISRDACSNRTITTMRKAMA